jgi:hypothetical protein
MNMWRVGEDMGSKETDECPLTLTHRLSSTPRSPLLIPQPHRTSLRCIGTGPHDTMAPSAVMWTPIYGRLGDRRLGTVIPCISFVD